MDTIPPEYLEMNREQLVGSVWNGNPQSIPVAAVERLLHLRQMESEEAGTAALVAATANLVTGTRRLACATWALVGVTAVLVLVAASQAYLMFTAAE
jgi:hypothetical protein